MGWRNLTGPSSWFWSWWKASIPRDRSPKRIPDQNPSDSELRIVWRPHTIGELLMTPKWFRGPRQLRLIFLATMLLLAGTLGWLGWRLLQQDQQLSSQQMAER